MLCDRLGFPEWKTDARFVTNSDRVQNRGMIDDLIEDVTKQKSTQEWLEIFEGSGMPYAAVNDIQGTLNHSHGKSYSDSQVGLRILTLRQSKREGWSRRLSIPIVVP